METEALSKRESEILSHLVEGGRVSTIAQKLFLSPHTVRNHLRNIFWKLGVHSQAELIEYVRESPDILGDLAPAREAGAGSTDDLMGPYNEANARLAARIDEILREHWGPRGVRELMRAALPLDEERRADWRHRLDLWSRERTDPHLTAKRDAQIAPWRERAGERIRKAQQEGWMRGDQEPDEQASELVKLRYFVGMTLEEAAHAMGVSPRTVDRIWGYARAWLLKELQGGG